MLVVSNSNQLFEHRHQFERQMNKLITLVNEQTSCHHAIAESLAELKVLHSYIMYSDTITVNMYYH